MAAGVELAEVFEFDFDALGFDGAAELGGGHSASLALAGLLGQVLHGSAPTNPH